jgi:O-acetyl-ADP-ribose deacetylase (regulator of RNase III)
MCGVRVVLKSGDILAEPADGLVISANNDLILGGGISGVVARTGGPAIQEECNAIGTIPLGHVAVTRAGNLPFRHIFHLAIRPLGLWADEKSLRSALERLAREARQREVRTLAMPMLGTGNGGMSVDKSSMAIAEGLAAWLREGMAPEEVRVHVREEKHRPIVREALRGRLPPDVFEDRAGG